MAESTNDPESTKKDSKASEKNTGKPKINLAGIGAPAAGAATGAAVAAGIKFSDDIIEAVAGNTETDSAPDLDPNEPEPDTTPQSNSNTVTTSATPIAHAQSETGASAEQPDAEVNGHNTVDEIDGINAEESSSTADSTPDDGIPDTNLADKDPESEEIIDAVEAEEAYPDLYLVDSDGDGSYDAVEMDMDHDGVIDALYVSDEDYITAEEPDDEAAYQEEIEPDDIEMAYGDDDTYEDFGSDDAMDLDNIL